MWRRILSSNLKTLTLASAASASATATATATCRSAYSAPISASAALFVSRGFSSEVNDSVKKKIEDVMPIATGHELEELVAEIEEKDKSIDYPRGPFGTKEHPAVVKSTFDKRIVGCPGGEGEDEHDVVWFWLEKGKPHECPVCTQYFMLEVVGPGGSPDGHDDDDHHH